MRVITLSLFAAMSAVAAAPVAAQIQDAVSIEGTRLEIMATGESTQVPDLVIINAGVVTEAPTAQAALAQNASQMRSVLAALRQAGIAERDIQTASINLNPRYDYGNDRAPQLVGYNASNQLTIRFREIEQSGPIIDALVAQGVNQINGPSLQIEDPDDALDAARRDALTQARERADIYASALGMQVTRIVAVSESGNSRPPMPMAMRAQAESDASTQIVPGEQSLNVTLSVVFELQ